MKVRNWRLCGKKGSVVEMVLVDFEMEVSTVDLIVVDLKWGCW